MTESKVIRQSVRATWRGGQQYAVSREGAPSITIDGDRKAGPGPVETLLGALAACSSMDVIEYLAKRRTPAEQLEIVVDGVRRSVAPRRLISARLTFELRGEGIETHHASRAIDLAIQTYCSVASSLAPDVVVETQLILNGVPQPLVTQTIAPVPA
ncbi:MAG: OsmC family protein [Gemmatimonadetes bacterium]|nr:OsmC family protein [Gemmatimonadota bacterium]